MKKKKKESKLTKKANETLDLIAEVKAEQLVDAPIELGKHGSLLHRILRATLHDLKRTFMIFIHDIKKVSTNLVAVIVAIGVMLLPSLYAWFNIGASWDPYSKTGNLAVAVANEDAGTTLKGVDLNIGNKIVDALAGNDKIGWTFTDSEKAKEGVRSGKYYAAIVIPKEFSHDMVSILSDKIVRPELVYYVNEKKNAIAPKITNSGANTVQELVNKTFIEQTVTTVCDAIKEVNNSALAQDTKKQLENKLDLSVFDDATSMLKQTKTALEGLTYTTDVVAGNTDVFISLIDQVSNTLKQTDANVKKLSNSSSKVKSNLKNLGISLQEMTTLITQSVKMLGQSTNSLSTQLDTILKDLDKNVNTAKVTLGNVIKQANSTKIMIDSMVTALQGNTTLMQYETIQTVVSQLGQLSLKMELLIKDLNTANTQIGTSQDKAKKQMKQASSTIATMKKQMTSIEASFKKAKVSMKELSDSASQASSVVSSMADGLGATMPLVTQTMTATKKMLASTKVSLGSLGKLMKASNKSIDKGITDLATTKKQIQNMENQVDDLLAGKWKEKLEKELGITLPDLSSDAGEIADFLSSPVKLNTKEVFKIVNYGSALSPFYTILCLWVGGLILVSIFKVKASKDETLTFKGYRQHNLYYGRFMIFMVFGIIQAVIVCLGDLYYLKIQCVHPVLFVVAGVGAAIVFVNIIYTLTLAFGDVGKAIAVILLVLQVAGAGGTFPIECTPRFFQIINPLLPFTHGINAMREAVGGAYGHYFLFSMLKLFMYLPISIVFGTVCRKPIVWLNEFFHRRLDETGIM